MADEAAVVVEEGTSPAAESPLVSISFQKNVNRKEKYLEAEPKALGITQICLSVFQMSCVAVILSKGLVGVDVNTPFFILSVLVIIAGSLAIAAQNLHLPTLRACLAMQILASGASIFNGIFTLIKMDDMAYYCWPYYNDRSSAHQEQDTCHKITSTHSHLFAAGVVIHVTLLAISLTLAAYCCKVVKCCTPEPKVPVITVQAPPVQQ